MAHGECIENNRTTLLRCINLNEIIVARLRAEGVIDDGKESLLEAVKASLGRISLLIEWIKESTDNIYESFLRVMEKNEHQHVANLLRGKKEDNHVPLSLARHARLLEIRGDMMFMIHNSIGLIAALISSKAISKTDAEDLSVDRMPNYKKNFLLINAILRRSEYSFECLHQALGRTRQTDAADFLIEGDVIPVHISTTLSDLDEQLSESINTALMNESMDETAPKEIQIPHMNGLRIAGATPGSSIVVLVYCKTIDNVVTFTQLFSSGEMQTRLEDFLNRLLAQLKPIRAKRLRSSIRLNKEDILKIEEITGIQDFVIMERTKVLQSRVILESRKPTEVEEKPKKEILSVIGRTPEEKQAKRDFYETFESLLSEEEEILESFILEKATSDQGQDWKQRRNMVSDILGQMLQAQTTIFKAFLTEATSCEGSRKTRALMPFAKHIYQKLQQQEQLWRNLKLQALDEHSELDPSTFQTRVDAPVIVKIGLLLDNVRNLKRQLFAVKEKFIKGDLFLALENLKTEEDEKQKPRDIQRPSKSVYTRKTRGRRGGSLQVSLERLIVGEEKELQQLGNIHQSERSKQYSIMKMSHPDAIQKNFEVLIRCTTINFYVLDYLRAKDVIDDAQESDLKAEMSLLKQRILLLQWLKKASSDKYETFLQVMRNTDQEHVANLLTGSTEDGNLPLSGVSYKCLTKCRYELANCMHTGYEVIDRLKSLNAISTIDAEEIKEEKGAYRMSTKLLSAIMRRSNRCYNNFQEVLRETGQQHVVEMLSCDDVSAVDVDIDIIRHPRLTLYEGFKAEIELAKLKGVDLN